MKKIRVICLFVLFALIAQTMFIFAFTTRGLDMIYPLVRRFTSESVEIADNSYVEYYNVTADVSEAEIIVIGADKGISQTYFVLSDFLRYIKRNVNVSAVALEIGEAETVIINDCIYAADDVEFNRKIVKLEGLDGMSMEYMSFVEALYKINRTMPPDKKLTVYGIGLDSSAEIICESVDEAIKHLYADLGGSYKYYLKSRMIDEFVDYFYTDAPSKTEIFGELYDQIKQICDEYDVQRKMGRNTDASLHRLLGIAADKSGGRLLTVVDSDRLAYGAEFRNLLETGINNSLKVLMTELRYNNCFYNETAENGETVEKNDLYFPVFTDDVAVHLVRKKAMAGFTDYYTSVTKKTNEENDREFEFYLVISNSDGMTPYVAGEYEARVDVPSENQNETQDTDGEINEAAEE